MNKKWDEVTIGRYCKLQGGYAFKSSQFVEEGVPVVKIKNIQNITATLEGSQCFPEEDITEKLTKFKLYNGDILIAMTGAGSVGRVGKLWCSDNRFGLLNQRVGRFDVNPEFLSRDFLYYTLIQSKFREALFMAGSGSGQPNLSPSQIEGFNIILPPLPEQKAIARILGKLDDKIELNRRMNQSLENMAQVLFKSWFVDFDPVIDNALLAGQDIPEALQSKVAKRLKVKESQGLQADERFPDRFVYDEDLGKYIPEGWEVKAVNDVTLKVTDGTHSTVKDDPHGKFYLLSCKNIKNGLVNISDKDRKINVDTLAKLRKRTGLRKNDILLTTVGTIGEVALINTNEVNFELQRSVAIIRPDEKHISTSYLHNYVLDNYFQHEALNRSEGSVQTCLFLGAIKSVPVLVPSKKATYNFDKMIGCYTLRKLNYYNQIQTLTQLRDTLLPQLISGKLKVPEAMLRAEESID